MTTTLIDGCEWNKNVESIDCGPDDKLHLASNMKKYCLRHQRMVEYVLVSANGGTLLSPTKTKLSKSDSSLSQKQDKKEGGSHSDGEDIRLHEVTPLSLLAKEKVCYAKGCTDTNIKAIYQGLFCPLHEKVVRLYRCITDLNRRDEYELYIREMEQSLRKVPHPLYQKQINVLNSEIRIKEAEYINMLFSSIA